MKKTKDGKVYDEYEVIFKLRGNSRKELRDAVVNKFLAEEGGYWKEGIKHVTLYKYFVETLEDGRRIFLLRPTFLNKGIDFQVWVERLTDGKDDRPSHEDILNDLSLKYRENHKNTKELVTLIDKVWNCQDPEIILKEVNLKFKSGFSVEMTLKILKWLFIEQDVTYWNYDGRGMLRMAINTKLEQSSL